MSSDPISTGFSESFHFPSSPTSGATVGATVDPLQEVVNYQSKGPSGVANYSVCDEFLVLSDNSYFDIFPNSHKTTRGVEGEPSVLSSKVRVSLSKGDVIIFQETQ